MGYTSEPELLVLHAVRVKGYAEPDHVAEATALPDGDVVSMLMTLREQELVGRRDGRISGYTLTATGKGRHAELLASERVEAGCDDVLEWAYDVFVEQNQTLKQLCTEWQLRTVSGSTVPNDHSDADYDAAIAARLVALQAEVRPVIERMAGGLNRFCPYGERFDDAVARFSRGDRHAFVRPLSRSYHDVWMELHEDLLLTLGRDRSEADGF